MMNNNQRDYNYYEEHAANVTLGDITSCEHNKRILRWLRDGNDEYFNKFPRITLRLRDNYEYLSRFALDKCNDLGWLGYFIGKSEHLRTLNIHGSPEDEEEEEQRIIRTLCDGIARNQSIQKVFLCDLSNDGFATIARALTNLTQLEELDVFRCMDNDNTLVTLLESGVKLKKMSHDTGVATFANGFRSIGTSLEYLGMCNIGNGGVFSLAEALAGCTNIKKLDLFNNDFSMAAAGLRALSGWLQTAGIQLDALQLRECNINDEGLEALVEGAVSHCKYLDLQANQITASGLRLLSTALQSERCCVEELNLSFMSIGIGDDGAEALARALGSNKRLRRLYLLGDGEENVSIMPAGWSAFSKALCDTSSVNNTYLSNHTLRQLWEGNEDYDPCYDHEDIPENLIQFLWLNRKYPQHAARFKILMSHAHLDMKPLLKWELKFLPLAVGWFERAKPCTTLSIDRYTYAYGYPIVVVESDEVFQSRRLSALYEFVSEYPKKVLERRSELTLVAAYDDTIAMVEFEKKKLREEVEKRGREIDRLNKENKELRENTKEQVNHHFFDLSSVALSLVIMIVPILMGAIINLVGSRDFDSDAADDEL